MTLLYFAYGSNLCLRRLRERVPGARLADTGRLHGFELRWNKRSVDASGKCNATKCLEGAGVLGALIQLPADQRIALDRIEEGYENIAVAIESRGERVPAFTYTAHSTMVDDDLRPYTWYHDLVVAGAASLDLPAGYIASLRKVEPIPDPDRRRARENRAYLPCTMVG